MERVEEDVWAKKKKKNLSFTQESIELTDCQLVFRRVPSSKSDILKHELEFVDRLVSLPRKIKKIWDETKKNPTPLRRKSSASIPLIT